MTDEETVAAPYEVFVVDGKPGHNERQIIDWLKAQLYQRIDKKNREIHGIPSDPVELLATARKEASELVKIKTLP